MGQMKKSHFIQAGLGLAVLLILAGGGILMGSPPDAVYTQESIQTSGRDILGWLAYGCLAASVVLLLCIGREISRSFFNPADSVNEAVHALSMKDGPALADALASLARGDLTVRWDVSSKPLHSSVGAGFSGFVSSYNLFLESLRECAANLNSITDEPCRRLFYVGSDSYLEGRTCAEAMGDALGGRGQVAILLGSFEQVSHQLRRKGFESLLREKFPQIQIMDVGETRARLDTTESQTLDILRRHPALAGIYTTEGGYPFGVAQAAEKAGVGGKLKIICHDMVEETMRYLSQGVITATIGQDPFAQGYDTVVLLFNHLAHGWRPSEPRMLTRNDVVSKADVVKYWQAGKGIIETEEMALRRAKPLGVSGKPLRIAVLGREESSFWDPVQAGVRAAADLLKPMRATVEWVVPEARGEFSVATRAAAVERLMAERWDGIATDVFDRGLIPCINRAVSAGIPVATFNGEPSSLRGLMDLLFQRSRELLEVSRSLTEAAQQTRCATQQTANTLQQMASAATDEATSMDKANSSVQGIVRSIEEIAKGSSDQSLASENVLRASDQIAQAIQQVSGTMEKVAQAAGQSADTAGHGTDAVRRTLQQMTQIQKTVDTLASAIGDMGEYSKQIGEVVVVIDDISAQVNLLALNASIESARAGEQGRGFAVVANEIRKLATRSEAATKEISALIQNVQSSISNAEGSMKTAILRVQEGTDLAARSGKALDELLVSAVDMQQQTQDMVQTNALLAQVTRDLKSSINQVATVIRESVRATDAVKGGANQTMEVVEGVAAIVEENAASTEEISASTEQVAHTAEEVGTRAEALAEIARELQGAIAQFKISEKE